MCMQSVIPSAISLFGKLFKKGDSALGHLFQRLQAPSLRSCPTRLAAGLGLLRSGFCRRIPACPPWAGPYRASRVLAHLPSAAAFSSPEMDQAQKTGGSDGLGGQGGQGRVLCPCQPPFLQEYP